MALPDRLSLIPETYMVERRKRLPPVVLCLYSHGGTCKIKMTLGSNLENKAGQMAEILTFYPQLIF